MAKVQKQYSGHSNILAKADKSVTLGTLGTFLVPAYPVREGLRMDRYVCTVCGYVYDPEEGDPDSGIEPGTPFEELPDDWICPVCGAAKDEFEKEE